MRFTYEQRLAIRRAASDARKLGGLSSTFDVVDLATETGNYFWTGLNDRQARVACRYVALVGSAI